jgi:hypothetical protein
LRLDDGGTGNYPSPSIRPKPAYKYARNVVGASITPGRGRPH